MPQGYIIYWMINKMKILLTISSMDPRFGGVVEYINQIAPLLLTKNSAVEVACMDNPDEEWVTNSSYKINATGDIKSTYSFSIRFLKWLDLNITRFDVVLINGIWQYHSYAAYSMCKKHHIPYFLLPHGMLDPWFKKTYPLKHFKKLIYWTFFERRVVNNAKGLIFTCDEEKFAARHSFPGYSPAEYVSVLGLKKNDYDVTEAKIFFFQKFPNIRGKKIITFMGRIHEKKGCDLILEAIKKNKKKLAGYHMLFAGPNESEYGLSLKRRSAELGLEEMITWAGMLSGIQKWGAYYSSDVLFLPSHQENFGIVVAEALSCGVPVIISNKVNIWREIKSSQAGLICEDNGTSASNVLSKWLDMPESEKYFLKINSIRCFEEKFEITKAVSSLISVIKNI